MKILNNKQVKKLLATIKEQHGKEISIDHYFIRVFKDRFYLISKDISKINVEELNIKSIGLYLGKLDNNKLLISDEAAHLLDITPI